MDPNFIKADSENSDQNGQMSIMVDTNDRFWLRSA